MGRYVLTPAIFPALRETTPGALGEIQLTDAIGRLLATDEVWGVEFEGELLDVGTPAGWLATNMRLARRPSLNSRAHSVASTRQVVRRMNALRREWGAVTFVVTILIGAVAVAISLGVSAARGTPIQSADPVSRPNHPIRGHADPCARPRRRSPSTSGKAKPPRATPTPTATPIPTADRDPNPDQPGAAGLPNRSTRHRSPSPTPTPRQPDRHRRDTDGNADTHSDAGPDHPAELDAAAHRNPDLRPPRTRRG